MKSTFRSLRLGFSGTPQFAVAALDALTASRHRVLAVFTQPDRPAGRGQAVQVSAVKRRAIEHSISVHQPQNFKSDEALTTLRDLELDAFVVVAYGLILPPPVLAIPREGCFNIHASRLPRWRGAAPIQRALLAGDQVTGVTIMRMDAGLDTGPMLAERVVPITDRDTAGSLHDRLAQVGAELIVETLDGVADGEVRERPQPPEGATYAAKINKAEALIDWNLDATEVLRRVRAFNPWPIAETTLNGSQLRVWEAELGDAPAAAPAGTVFGASNQGIDVACGRGSLRILRLQLAGRKPLVAREFLKAQRLLGTRLAQP